MAHKKNTTTARTIALCYVRKSWVKDDSDLVSPEIQRRNIQRVCESNGWIPEWHEDVEGHKSGMHEKNRPGWLEVKARLRDGDVAALVANDLSRLHRRGWRIGDLLDFVDRHKVTLVLADPAKQMDLEAELYIDVSFSSVNDAIRWIATQLPAVTDPNADRNRVIRSRRAAGEPVAKLAREYGVSDTRIRQILTAPA